MNVLDSRAILAADEDTPFTVDITRLESQHG